MSFYPWHSLPSPSKLLIRTLPWLHTTQPFTETTRQVKQKRWSTIADLTQVTCPQVTHRLDSHPPDLKGCSGCIEDVTCGYCFDDHEGGLGSCLAGDKSVEYGKSMFDMCSNGTIAEQKRVWAMDWCPSKYSWMTLFGLCLYLFFFGPGMGLVTLVQLQSSSCIRMLQVPFHCHHHHNHSRHHSSSSS